HSDKVLEGLHLVFVELPKFKAKNLTEKKMQVLWLRFLTEIGEATKAAPRELVEDPHVNQALEILEESAYNAAEMYAYDRFWDYVSREATKEAEMKEALEKLDAATAERDAATARADAATARADAEKARADEALEKLRQTARNLKSMNLTTEQIAAATGLADDEIARL
ncbi:MAG: PD-(D/E)XK nuclease family transposase, partial [Kiritimatiellae bacterium]|nr:PD-(D/E)XK nuclease family transposase [Kiritimatiellia bacterium]